MLPIVIGSYARKRNENLDIYDWTCFVFDSRNPYADIGHVIEKVRFVLHKSFKDPVREKLAAPFFISAEGWGEFHITVEMYILGDRCVKVQHYLKLNAADAIVANESFDTLILPPGFDYTSTCTIPPSMGRVPIPIFDDLPISANTRYIESESDFICIHSALLNQKRSGIFDLLRRAISREVELLTVLESGLNK
jgi:hypothetical protein